MFTFLLIAKGEIMNRQILESIDRLAKYQNDFRFKHENHLSDIYEFLIAKDKEAMFVDYILDKQIDNDIIHVKALAHCELDSSHICEIHLDNQGDSEYGIVPDWDYNVDLYLLADLEDGYQIKYMPLEDHAGHWYCINELRGEINAEKGLQIYLSYCQKQGITHELLSTVRKDVPDIRDMYREINQDYRIIAQVTSGDKAIVLGYNKHAPQRYVTWTTTHNRRRGYDVGHFYNNYAKAFKDFNARSHDMLDDRIQYQRKKIKSKEKYHDER